MTYKYSDCVNPSCYLGLPDWWKEANPDPSGGVLDIGKCDTCGTVQVRCDCDELVAIDVGRVDCTGCDVVYETDRDMEVCRTVRHAADDAAAPERIMTPARRQAWRSRPYPGPRRPAARRISGVANFRYGRRL
jgi:hypothetical protein